jgi:hypothetical protein
VLIKGRACSTYGESRNSHRVLVGKHEEKNHLQNLVVDERIQKWISKKWNEKACTGLFWLRTKTGNGLL